MVGSTGSFRDGTECPPLPPKNHHSGSCSPSDELLGTVVQPEDVSYASSQSTDEFPSVNQPQTMRQVSLLQQFQNGQIEFFHRHGDVFGARTGDSQMTKSLFSDPFWSNKSSLLAGLSPRQSTPEPESDQNSSVEDLLATTTSSVSDTDTDNQANCLSNSSRRVGLTVERTTMIKSTKTRVTVSQGVTRVTGSLSESGAGGTVTRTVENVVSSSASTPPALPEKQRRPSHYDNVPSPVRTNGVVSTTVHSGLEFQPHASTSVSKCGMVTQRVLMSKGDGPPELLSSQKMATLTVEKDGKVVTQYTKSVAGEPMEDDSEPPPLPLKKRHIMAYMQMFGDYAVPNVQEFLVNRQSTYSINLFHNMLQPRFATWPQNLHPQNLHNFQGMMSNSDDSGMFSLDMSQPDEEGAPPALPPKKRQLAITSGANKADELREKSVSMIEQSSEQEERENVKRNSVPLDGEVLPPHLLKDDTSPDNPLISLDATPCLLFKKEGEDGPDLRGGTVDGLLVLAACRAKNQNGKRNSNI